MTRKVTKGLVPCLDCRNDLSKLSLDKPFLMEEKLPCFQVIGDQNEKIDMQKEHAKYDCMFIQLKEKIYEVYHCIFLQVYK